MSEGAWTRDVQRKGVVWERIESSIREVKNPGIGEMEWRLAVWIANFHMRGVPYPQDWQIEQWVEQYHG